MGIFKGTVQKINRETLSTTKEYLFNTNRIGELIADSTDSIFKYTKNILDRRESADEFKIDETKETVDGFWGGDDQEIIFSALKKRVDGKGAAIDYAKTITVGIDKIGFGWADPDDATKSWIEVYGNANKKVLYQIDQALASLNGLANILTFDFLDADNVALSADALGTIDWDAGTIAVDVPSGTTITALVAAFTLTTGASVVVGATPQVSGTTANDFTSDVDYDVTGSNGDTKTFTVTVTILP